LIPNKTKEFFAALTAIALNSVGPQRWQRGKDHDVFEQAAMLAVTIAHAPLNSQHN